MYGRRTRRNLKQTIIEKADQLLASPGAAMAKWLIVRERPHAAPIGHGHNNPALRRQDTPGLSQQLPRTIGLVQSVEQKNAVKQTFREGQSVFRDKAQALSFLRSVPHRSNFFRDCADARRRIVLPKRQQRPRKPDTEHTHAVARPPEIQHPSPHQTRGGSAQSRLIKSFEGCRRLAHMALVFQFANYSEEMGSC